MSTRHFNDLTPAEDERLALLAEECAEVIQAVTKIQRHGYYSTHPVTGVMNRDQLEHEMGDVRAAMMILCEAGDTDKFAVHANADKKLKTVGQYMHHQPKDFL